MNELLRRKSPSVFLLIAMMTLGWSSTPQADDSGWPQFRGSDSMGVAKDDPRLPEEWGPDKNIVWKTPIEGLGWSSPIVFGDRIYVTSVLNEGDMEPPKKGLYFGGERPTPETQHQWLVYALDFETGKEIWRKAVHRAVPDFSRHLKNTYASETPVTDGTYIYAYFGNVGVFALSLEGDVIWERRYETVPMRYGWGTAASPILHDGRLYIVNDNDDQSWMEALNAKTGEVIWHVERDEVSNWATPFVWENEQRTEIITVGTKKVRSYDLDGNELWYMRGMSSISIPTPFTKYGLLYIATGYVGDKRRPMLAVKPGGEGNITVDPKTLENEHVAWYLKDSGPYNPTPILYQDILYVLLDRGFLTAHNPKTGELIYDKQRFEKIANAFTASPWAYNGKIFCLSEDGDTYVVQASEEFKILGKNSLDEMFMATPAIANGSLILRGAQNLYRIQNQ